MRERSTTSMMKKRLWKESELWAAEKELEVVTEIMFGVLISCYRFRFWGFENSFPIQIQIPGF